MTKKVSAPIKPAKNHSSLASPVGLAAFADHIRELRRRVLWVALVFLVTSSAAYGVHSQLVQLVMQPLGGDKLIYLTPGGGFSFIFQITLYAGLIAAGPMLMYQLYAFVRPALPAHARRSAPKVVGVAVALMLLGVGYGYFVAIPAALQFLANFAGDNVLPTLTADSYLSFFLSYVAGLGLLFQLPLLLVFWHWIKPMGPGGLLKSERLVILFAFIAAALVTPTPDIVNQAMVAVPLILVYQGGVVAVLLSIIRRSKRAKNTVPASPTTRQSAPVTQPQPVPVPVVAAPVQSPNNSAMKHRSIQGIDGFIGFQQKQPGRTIPASCPLRPTTLKVPERTNAQPLMRRRSLLSVDGISSV